MNRGSGSITALTHTLLALCHSLLSLFNFVSGLLFHTFIKRCPDQSSILDMFPPHGIRKKELIIRTLILLANRGLEGRQSQNKAGCLCVRITSVAFRRCSSPQIHRVRPIITYWPCLPSASHEANITTLSSSRP